MDMQSLLAQMLSADSVKGLSRASGTSNADVKKVLTQALPLLLGGADAQAKNSDTAESFTKALAQHAKDDTSDLGSFLGNIDLEDGAKIIGHLLGSQKSSATKSVARQTGVSEDSIGTILAAVAPLLMSLLGQQTGSGKEEDSSPIADLMGALLENVDVGSLLLSVLTDSGDDEPAPATTTTAGGKNLTRASSRKKSSPLGGIVSSVLKGLLGK